MPDPANPDLERWPWPVKVHTLGRFRLLVDDQPIEFGRKVQQKPLALLKALVALGGGEIPMGRLADLLWPDADGDRALKALEAALGRLRRLLGRTDPLELKAGHLSLSRQHCWVDVWSFERSVGRAARARKERNEEESSRLLEKALSLYRGSFLPSEEMPWALPPREKLRAQFLALVEQLGEICEGAGRWEEAVSCYRRGIEADELAEELYRRLMGCHIRMGREAEAIAVYRRCWRTLSSVLGVQPSADTRAIAASLGPTPG
jgi:DNA-binding SARP family transcriptional activator